MKHLFLFYIILALSLVAHADQRGNGSRGGALGIYFDETFFPVYVNKNDTTSITAPPGVATESGLGFDTYTTLGYVFWNSRALFGLTYNVYSLQTKRANVETGDSGLNEKTKDIKFGPTIGWFNGGFRVLFTFFVSGEKELHTIHFGSSTEDKKITNKEMTGYQLSFGYNFPLWAGFEVGPSLNYISVEYKKQSYVDALNPINNYNVTLYSPYVHSEIKPMISLVGRF